MLAAMWHASVVVYTVRVSAAEAEAEAEVKRTART